MKERSCLLRLNLQKSNSWNCKCILKKELHFEEFVLFARMGSVPLAHLFALKKSIQSDGVCCKRSVRIMAKDGLLVSAVSLSLKKWVVLSMPEINGYATYGFARALVGGDLREPGETPRLSFSIPAQKGPTNLVHMNDHELMS